jgi:hypothetical protein
VHFLDKASRDLFICAKYLFVGAKAAIQQCPSTGSTAMSLAALMGTPQSTGELGRSAAMFIRDAFIAIGIFGFASTACANSCANVNVIGSFDESGLTESDFGIYAAGTFRIEGEVDEAKQPMFNLATVNCEKQFDHKGRASLECKVTMAVVWAEPDKPNTDNPKGMSRPLLN